MKNEDFTNYSKDRIVWEVCHYWELLSMMGIRFNQILDKLCISQIYIYGAGHMGARLYKEIRDSNKVAAFIDSSREKQKHGLFDKKVLGINEIPNDGLPIIITPASNYQNITQNLMKQGIKAERLLPLRFVQRLGVEGVIRGKKVPLWNTKYQKFEEQFLITGATFVNKGAQAMLFVAINEIKKRFPKAIIYFLVGDMGLNSPEEIKKEYDFIFWVEDNWEHASIFDALPNMTAIVDVSGYALSSNWNCNWYVRILRKAKESNTPLFLMPQSYGPFEFDKEKNEEIKELLTHPKAIFTRESISYRWFCEQYQLKNVRTSDDLVLQNKGVDLRNIKTSIESNTVEYIQIPNTSNIAIIPNIRTYTFGNKEHILEMYNRLIERLCKMGKNIYIVMHSDDNEVCDDIYAMFAQNPRVFYIKEEMDCFEYEAFICQFEFIIASRYHAIIHAFKQNIPCIAVGWAEKYSELMNRVEQNEFVFDVREELSITNIENAIIKMSDTLVKQKEKLAIAISNIQTNNCFDCLEIITPNGINNDRGPA